MLLTTNQDDHRIAWFTALAIAIHVVESQIPSPIPGIKPGLANVVSLVVLTLYSWKMAAWVGILRVLVGSLIIGSFLSPGFMLSMTGTICSLAALALGSRISSISLVGLSVLAAMSHMAGQFFVAYWMFIPHSGLFTLLPILMTAALIFGLFSGIIAQRTIKALQA